jgi:hypothetical protein
MTQLNDLPVTTSVRTDAPDGPDDRRLSTPLSVRQLNLLRVGYLVLGGGLAVKKWPLLLDHEPWELMEGTVQVMLVAMSVLALLGLRYPVRMLPILLFEVAWKLLWLGVVALPMWAAGNLRGDILEQTWTVLLVVIFIAVIPWRHVLTRFVLAPGDPWRRDQRPLAR